MKITSSAFQDEHSIPARFTADGDDVSPALEWSDVPEGTRQFALICEDPDAPRPEPWIHWVMYGISKDVRALPEGIPDHQRPSVVKGALQGLNSWELIGYNGPKPPRGSGPHRYFFTLYALDAALDVGPQLEKDDLLAEMNGHVLQTAQLMGTYERAR